MNINLNVDTLKRFYTLRSHKIYSMPIVILMPHSRCNCRCVMCDIWKGNNDVRQINESDVEKLMESFRKFNTKLVVMSGGEALMHPNFFKLCDIIKTQKIDICILSTGLLLKKYASEIITRTDEVIVSLDGSRDVHDKIRNIPNAFDELKDGVQELKKLNKNYRITARCVVQQDNFRDLSNIVNAGHEIGLDRISFLAADVSTDAFNRPELWGEEKISEVKLSKEELKIFKDEIEALIKSHQLDFENKFIAESPEKIRGFYNYYAAFHGLSEFPQISCNAPWVSAVVEPDGTVRPCFFHNKVGNINEEELNAIVNSEKSISFRKNLDVKTNLICRRCVCSLNLSPLAKL